MHITKERYLDHYHENGLVTLENSTALSQMGKNGFLLHPHILLLTPSSYFTCMRDSQFTYVYFSLACVMYRIQVGVISVVDWILLFLERKAGMSVQMFYLSLISWL